jgi:hypothetical protein
MLKIELLIDAKKKNIMKMHNNVKINLTRRIEIKSKGISFIVIL